MRIERAADRASKPAPPANFTGVVYRDEVAAGAPPSRLRASVVSFAPGARRAWHAHPVGQTLCCPSGVGRAQREGERVEALRRGDTVPIPPGVRHRHGAAPDRIFAHPAMPENGPNGGGTEWFEPAAEADDAAPPAVPSWSRRSRWGRPIAVRRSGNTRVLGPARRPHVHARPRRRRRHRHRRLAQHAARPGGGPCAPSGRTSAPSPAPARSRWIGAPGRIPLPTSPAPEVVGAMPMARGRRERRRRR